MAQAPYNDPAAPDYPSSAWRAQIEYWNKVDDIMAGAERIRSCRRKYLPQFEEESEKEYNNRVAVSPWTPIYKDSFRQLAAKPFSQEVRLAEDHDASLDSLVENIDSAGTHMHVFAREVFENAINYGIDWIYVDYTKIRPGATLADERRVGARPYWTRVPAERMLAVYEAMVDGELQFVHARMEEYDSRREGYEEIFTRRIRVLDREAKVDPATGVVVGWGPATYQVWEEQITSVPASGTSQAREDRTWSMVDSGPISKGVIMLVPVVTGIRPVGSWVVEPPLRDLAEMQITMYQMESNRARVQTMTAFPIYVVRGVEKPKGVQAFGPRTVLWIPPVRDGELGDFHFEEPSGEAARSLREDIEQHRREMRQAGMQPMTPESGVVTAMAIAVAEAKAHSALESWAIGLKDALEQAWVYTCMWIGSEDKAPAVSVKTELISDRDEKDMEAIDKMHDKALVSGRQYQDEATRRGILGPNYDRAADAKQIAVEGLAATEGDTSGEGETETEKDRPSGGEQTGAGSGGQSGKD